MHLCTQSRLRLLLLCAALAMFTGCVSTSRPVASLEAPTPSESSASTETDVPSPVEAGSYRVNDGDTLVSIARSFGRAPASVARWNKMSVTDAVSVGQVLRVAPPTGAASKSTITGASKPAVTAKPSPASASVETTRFKWPVPVPVATKFVTGRSKGVELGGRAASQSKLPEAAGWSTRARASRPMAA